MWLPIFFQDAAQPCDDLESPVRCMQCRSNFQFFAFRRSMLGVHLSMQMPNESSVVLVQLDVAMTREIKLYWR